MNNPKARSYDLVVQESGEEFLIYDLNNHKAIMLNETSAAIWQMCDGKMSVKQITEALAQKINMPLSEEIVWLALDDFKRNNLLTDNEQLKIEFGGLSRREVIRKVGFASMIALPVISAIIAPQAANAASPFLALNATCSSSSQCISGNCQSGPPNTPRCCTQFAASGSPTTGNGSPNQAIGCDPGCTNVNTCCSGSARVGPAIPFCTGFGADTCYCN